jgi:hypothetical protein
MEEQMTQRSIPRKWPFGLYVIVAVQFLVALLLALGLAIDEVAELRLQIPVANNLLPTSLTWALVVALLVASLGLVRLKRWGWTLTMILTGAGLALSIWQYSKGEARYLDMALYVVIVFYLNQRELQSLFMGQGPR